MPSNKETFQIRESLEVEAGEHLLFWGDREQMFFWPSSSVTTGGETLIVGLASRATDYGQGDFSDQLSQKATSPYVRALALDSIKEGTVCLRKPKVGIDSDSGEPVVIWPRGYVDEEFEFGSIQRWDGEGRTYC